MKYFLLLFLVFGTYATVNAKHITGGEVIYDFVSSSASGKTYSITLRLFRDNLGGGAAMPPSVGLRIFNNDNNAQYGPDLSVGLTLQQPVNIVSQPPCLTNSPLFDYSIGLYNFEVTLPNNSTGFTISYQTCCRVQNIDNIGNGANGQVGSTYVGEIPGTSSVSNNQIDNSARFETGISIICDNKPFSLNFSATDPDSQDVLKYEFYDAYNGGDATNAGFSTPAPPPYGSVGYSSGFAGNLPLGSSATINSNTGIISGIAPASGKYVVAVLVKSFRNGILIAIHRKDFIVTVAPCDFANADLHPNVVQNCDAFTNTFSNGNTSALIQTWDWDFGEPSSGANNTSTLEFPTHVYQAAGDYIVRLIINKDLTCPSNDSLILHLYPGFFPKIAPIPDQCKNTQIQFNDLTTANYGSINFWKWDFGVTTLTNDTSRLQNPTYTYTQAGAYNGTFIVQSSKGCRDTLYPIINVSDFPDLKISNDTLICTVDTIQLHSNFTTGSITWTPNYMITDQHSFNPMVSPDITTTYTASYQDQFGCPATKKVTVNVVNEVTLLYANDTTICRTDTTTLFLNTDALYFNWTPTNVIQNPTVKNPIIFPIADSTLFHVKASISNKCFKEKDIKVKTVPYPQPIIIGDTLICYGKSDTLKASGGSSYAWLPTTYLNNASIPNPIAVFPKQTITYTVSVTDTLGCPKAVKANLKVNVVRIIADAGPSDTSVVINQPLLLQATGSTNYLWTPNKWLTSNIISNPTSLPQNNITYSVEVSNSIGCKATDTINVKLFFLPPDVYVPSAFTPNGDANNDFFRPIALGIKSLENFSVYNRWGEKIFETSRIYDGWNGKYKGVLQDPATYVWQINATDYKGNKIFRKGTVILIR